MVALNLILFYTGLLATVGFLALYGSTARWWRNPLGRVVAFESGVILVFYLRSLMYILSGAPVHAGPVDVGFNGLITAMLLARFGTYLYVWLKTRKAK